MWVPMSPCDQATLYVGIDGYKYLKYCKHDQTQKAIKKSDLFTHSNCWKGIQFYIQTKMLEKFEISEYITMLANKQFQILINAGK